MDEALKEQQDELAEPVIQAGRTAEPEVPQVKEITVAAQTASTFWTTVKKWLTIHPKVKAAFLGVLLVAFAALDNAYNGGESYRQAAHEAGGAALVAILAYLKSA